jgi:hypothetical protein
MLGEALVWTVPIEVGGVFVEDPAGVAFVEDQGPVGASFRTLRMNRSA